MSKMTRHGIVNDLILAAKIMEDVGTFPTGTSIMRDAAKEIERLRDELVQIMTDRPFVMGWNEGWDCALEQQNDLSSKEPTK